MMRFAWICLYTSLALSAWVMLRGLPAIKSVPAFQPAAAGASAEDTGNIAYACPEHIGAQLRRPLQDVVEVVIVAQQTPPPFEWVGSARHADGTITCVWLLAQGRQHSVNVGDEFQGYRITHVGADTLTVLHLASSQTSTLLPRP